GLEKHHSRMKLGSGNHIVFFDVFLKKAITKVKGKFSSIFQRKFKEKTTLSNVLSRVDSQERTSVKEEPRIFEGYESHGTRTSALIESIVISKEPIWIKIFDAPLFSDNFSRSALVVSSGGSGIIKVEIVNNDPAQGFPGIKRLKSKKLITSGGETSITWDQFFSASSEQSQKFIPTITVSELKADLTSRHVFEVETAPLAFGNKKPKFYRDKDQSLNSEKLDLVISKLLPTSCQSSSADEKVDTPQTDDDEAMYVSETSPSKNQFSSNKNHDLAHIGAGSGDQKVRTNNSSLVKNRSESLPGKIFTQPDPIAIMQGIFKLLHEENY
ncbi:expressed protein, partial [Phakopsora pachyrhizi]